MADRVQGRIEDRDNSILNNNNIYTPQTFTPTQIGTKPVGSSLSSPNNYPVNSIPVQNSSMGIASTLPLIPYYQLWFGSFLLNSYWMRFITQVSFTDSSDEAGSASIDFIDRDYEFTDYMETVLGIDSEIWLYMGYEDNLRLMLHGKVSDIDYKHGMDGQQAFTINVIDTTYDMNTKCKTRSWKNVRASDVVRLIGEEYGYTCEIQDSEEVQEQISQDNETDIQLLKKLADDEAYELYVLPDENKLLYGKKFRGLVAKGVLNYKKDDFTILETDLTFVEKNTADKNKKDKKSSKNKSSSSGDDIGSSNDGVDIEVNVEDEDDYGGFDSGDYVSVVGRTGAMG